MKNLLLATLLLFSTLVQAGLPPTTSKVSGESTFSTTFKTDYGSFTGTRSGSALTLTGIGAASGASLTLGGTINANAILHLQSTTKTFIPPVMTNAQMTAISAANGSFVIDDTVKAPAYFNGTSWSYGFGSILADVSYSSQVAIAGTVSNENVDFINGNCTNASPSVCTFNTGIFTQAPNCIVNELQNASHMCSIWAVSNTDVSFKCNSDTGADNTTLIAKTISCDKAGADYTAAKSTVSLLSNTNYNPTLYTPTSQGLGTLSNVVCTHSRNGVYLDLDCNVLLGTVSGSTAQINLPGTLVAASDYRASVNSVVGSGGRDTNTAQWISVLTKPGQAYLEFGDNRSGSNHLVSSTGSALFASNNNFSFTARVKIQGWSNTVVNAYSNIQLLAPVASTSGTSIDFQIPTNAKRVVVMFNGVSTSGSSIIQVQLATGGSVATTGYVSGAGSRTGEVSSTTGMTWIVPQAANSFSGMLNLALSNTATDLWTASGTSARDLDGFMSANGGYKTLSGVLDRVRITTVNGTDTFDAGSISVSWEP